MTKQELLNRTKGFAIQIIHFVNEIPKNSTNNVLGNQLLRAATSIGANYRAACRAKSKADFIYKIKIVEEEADECIYWLELLEETTQYPRISVLMKEANELTAIFTQIGKTSKDSIEANRKSKIVNRKS
ncbi:MAG: hypothetical protein FD143_619 [Ignavibacteria bacterium]|nr:MAG: hypothetical protein FD143_619 [Ignavibacteria bacterium]KAF0161449.1 MAG: hypothetical protein FD188_820 [Ignavibacteria bacterium]